MSGPRETKGKIDSLISEITERWLDGETRIEVEAVHADRIRHDLKRLVVTLKVHDDTMKLMQRSSREAFEKQKREFLLAKKFVEEGGDRICTCDDVSGIDPLCDRHGKNP